MLSSPHLRRTLLALFAVSAVLVGAQAAEYVKPAPNLHIDGIPPIPESLAREVASYGNYRSASIVAWHPSKPGMLIRTAHKVTPQLFWVPSPSAKPELVTDYTDAVVSASYQPTHGEYLLFEKATGGDEAFRLYRLDFASKEATAISSAQEAAGSVSWNRAGDRIVYTSTSLDRQNAGEGAERVATRKLILVDPQKPENARVLATFTGAGWGGFRFSPDGKSLLYTETKSANESYLWLLTIEDGSRRRITPATKVGEDPVSYAGARFSADGKSVFATSDRNAEFRRLVVIDLDTGDERPLTAHLPHDVDEFSISTNANRIAFTTNQDGTSVLRFLDLTTFEELSRPALLPGVISGLRWRGPGGDESSGAGGTSVIAFNMSNARSPSDVYAYDVAAKTLQRWTRGGASALNPLEFVEPTLIRWTSFDGLGISGFLYQPSREKFPGKRPVLISIHGGPEGQARPNFIGRNNYTVNGLGIAIIFPNVRGSSGFGKRFLAADNGLKREDSVKDIGALLDWIKTQPDLDAERVAVSGGSYGGYMAQAVATHYPDRIAGGISSVGISNFITFLANTESYRRDLRRAEYGDERDPAIYKFLERISPLNNVQKIKAPMFIVQGKNDPRVPYTESVQIVDRLKQQKTPVWFLLADDEGHGFVKRGNQDYLQLAQIMFLRQTLLTPK